MVKATKMKVSRGRPVMSDSDRRHRVDVTLRQRDIDLAEVIGDGNRSKGD